MSRKSSILLGVVLVSLLLGPPIIGIENGTAVAYAGRVSDPVPGNVVPYQFIAKIYTEAYGRIPYGMEYLDRATYFYMNPDCVQAVKDTIQSYYTSGEFLGLYPENDPVVDRPTRLLALYRGALNREVDSAAVDRYTQSPWATQNWDDIVDDFIYGWSASRDAVDSLAAEVCTNWDQPYYWEDFLPVALPVVGPPGPPSSWEWVFCGAWCGQSDDDLQQMLNAAAAEPDVYNVYLAQRALVVVQNKNTIEIPAHVSLRTWGLAGLGPEHYAQMGRLVRHITLYRGDPVVRILTGGVMDAVWVDGQYTQVGGRLEANAANVKIEDNDNNSSPPTAILRSRLTDSVGTQSIFVAGGTNGCPDCYGVIVSGNLITAYATRHRPRFPGDAPWTDGIGVECGHAWVTGNQIVDATDVGIVIFRCIRQEGSDYHACVQRSIVEYNNVWNAGNSAYAAYAADPFKLPAIGTPFSFAGSSFQYNQLWTSPIAHVDFGLAVGTRAWSLHQFGTRAQFVYNYTRIPEPPLTSIVTDSPIAVSGMFDAEVYGNDLVYELDSSLTTCPSPDPQDPLKKMTASLGCGNNNCTWASFCSDPACLPPPPLETVSDVAIENCMSHPPQPSALPESSVAILPPYHNTPSFPVFWSGTAAGGLEIESFDIQYRDGYAGTWTDWLTYTTAISATFTGQHGHIFFFRSRARDSAGNVEPWPAHITILGDCDFDASTTVDLIPPSSQVHTLPAFSPQSFTIFWTGEDSTCQVQDYDVQVCWENCDLKPGGWTDWFTQTTMTSSTFIGEHGVTYQFRSRARDYAGNEEDCPSLADTATIVDIQPPETAINPMNLYTTEEAFLVSWSGSDDFSGLDHYDIYYRDESETHWQLWLEEVSSATTEAEFEGFPGHTYHFCSRGVDTVGNQESCPPPFVGDYDWPIESDAQIGVVPWSRVDDLPAYLAVTQFTVSWSGSPDVRAYDVEVRDGLYGEWVPWQSGVERTSAEYSGQYGHIYYFRCRAVESEMDAEELYPYDYDTYTKLVSPTEGGKSLGEGAYLLASPPDEAPDQMGAVTQTHPIGVPIEGYIGVEGDIDWYRFELTQTMRLRIELGSLPADYDLYVFGGDGGFLWASTLGFDRAEQVVVRVPAGVYYLRLAGYAGAWSEADPYLLSADIVK